MCLAKKILKITSLILFGFATLNVCAQDSKVDSLNNLIKNGTVDEQLEALSLLVSTNLYANQLKAEELAYQQLDLAEKHNKLNWKADALGNLGMLCFTQGSIDSAEIFYNQALLLLIETGDSSKMAVMNVNLSSAQRLLYKFDKAIDNLQTSLDYFRRHKDDMRVSQVLSNIGAAYNEMGYLEKHDEYALQALDIQEKIGSKKPMGITLINLCLSMSAQQKFPEAVEYGERAIRVFREINEPFLIGSALVRTAGAILFLGKDNRMLPYLEEAMKIAETIGNAHLKEEVFRLQSNYFLQIEKYSDAKTAAFNALALTDTSNKPNLQFLYDLLVTTSIYTNDKENVLKFYGKYLDVYEESVNQQWVSKISEMEVKYETEKKELKIVSLEKERKFIILLSVLGGVLLVTVIILIAARHKVISQKRKLAEQKIVQLEQEKQLIATKSLLEGETTERARLSKDLHDGLGGLLSVTKHKMANMKGSLTIPEEQVETFNSALEMLDNSIKELRRVAHNLMPESLMRYGLSAAIKDFCESIDNSTYHFYGVEKRIDEKLEVAAFRIVSELVNNALKHANANKINVQLVQEQDRISITVYDDGCGFNPKSVDKTKSVGLNSIEQRVVSFNGRIDILSEPGKGTEITVEFKS